MKGSWYTQSIAQTLNRLRTDASGGLSHKEAQKRLAKYGKNRLHPISRVAFYRSLRHILLDFTAILLLITALIGYAFGADSNSLMLAMIVLVHMLIVVLVLFRSERVLENMERDTLSLTHVVRQGKLFLTEPARLVPGDIIYLGQGDLVPADCRLVQSDGLCVDESAVFCDGEDRTAVHKMADLTLRQQPTGTLYSAANMLYGESVVMQGSCAAAVTATGARCMVCRTAGKTDVTVPRAAMPHERMFRKYGKNLSLSLIVVVFLLVVLQLALARSGEALFSSFLNAMTYAVSCMGEMFSAFCTVVVACGVYSTIKKHRDINTGAMIRCPGAIDRLKRLTTVIIPRRGVLTTRVQTIDYVCTPSRLYRVADTRYRSTLERVIRLGVVSTGCYGMERVTSGGQSAALGQEALAILSAARSLGLYNIDLDRRFPLVQYVRADGDISLFDMALVRGSSTGFTAVVRGRPEQILSRCRYYRDGEGATELSERRMAKLRESCHTLSAQAYTVVAIATNDVQTARAEYAPMYQSDMVFEGFLAFRVPLLADVGQLISRCKRENIKVVLFDENEDDSIAFAQKIGIAEGAEQCITGRQYAENDPAMNFMDAGNLRVYTDLAPGQRCAVIRDLQRQGETVGYLGKTMEDLAPMEAADVSFAQNVTLSDRAKNHIIPVESEITPGGIAESASRIGCEVLKDRADVILSEADENGNGGFAALMEALTAARSIEQNLLHVLYYLIPSSLARLAMVLFGILSGSVVMDAVQIAFSGLLLDFLAVMIICFETADASILRIPAQTQRRLQQPKNIMLSSLLYALVWTACSAALLAGLKLFYPALLPAQLLSASFLYWSVQQLIFLFIVKQERRDLRPGFKINGIQVATVAVIAEIFLLFFMYQPLGQRFGIVRFPPYLLLWILGAAAVFALLAALCKHLIDNCDRIRELPLQRAETKQRVGAAADAAAASAANGQTQPDEEPTAPTPTAEIQTVPVKDGVPDLSRVLSMIAQEDDAPLQTLLEEDLAAQSENSRVLEKLRRDPDASAQQLFPELEETQEIPVQPEDDYTEIEYYENQQNSNAELFARFGIELTDSEKAMLGDAAQPAAPAEESNQSDET